MSMIPDPESLHIVYGEAASGCVGQAFSLKRSSIFMIAEDLTERPVPGFDHYTLPREFDDSSLPILIWACFTAQELLFLGYVIALLEERGIASDRIYWMHSVEHDGDPCIESVSFHSPEDAATIYAPYPIEPATRLALVSLHEWWRSLPEPSATTTGTVSEPAYITECRNWLAGTIRPGEGRLSEFDNLILDHMEGCEMKAVALIAETLKNLRETCFFPSPYFIWNRIRELKGHLTLTAIEPGLDENSYSNYLVTATAAAFRS